MRSAAIGVALVVSLGCSARQQSPDATRESVADTAVDATAPAPDAGPPAPPPIPPLVIADGAATQPMGPGGLADWRSAMRGALADAGATGFTDAVIVDGAVVERASSGRLPSGEAMSGAASRPLGTVSRALTSLLTSALIEEGHLSWDSPVDQLRPDWKGAGTAPTLAELHCACFGVDAVPGPPPTSGARVIRALGERLAAGDALEAMPTSLLVAAGGYLAARAAPAVPLDPGDAYSRQLARRVTGPLRMPSVTIGPPTSPGRVPVYAPDRGAWATVDDLSKLALAMVEGGRTSSGGRVVESTAIDALIEPFDGQRGPATRGGWAIGRRGDLRVLGLGGWAGKGQTRIMLLPSARMAWVIRVEGTGAGLGAAIEDALDELIRARFGLPSAIPPVIDVGSPPDAGPMGDAGGVAAPDAKPATPEATGP